MLPFLFHFNVLGFQDVSFFSPNSNDPLGLVHLEALDMGS